MSTNDRFASVGQDGYVTAEDVLFLRKNVYQNNQLDQTEINSLLALAERAPEGDVEWSEFFGEASADYYFREELPHDFITERAFDGYIIRLHAIAKQSHRWFYPCWSN